MTADQMDYLERQKQIRDEQNYRIQRVSLARIAVEMLAAFGDGLKNTTLTYDQLPELIVLMTDKLEKGLFGEQGDGHSDEGV